MRIRRRWNAIAASLLLIACACFVAGAISGRTSPKQQAGLRVEPSMFDLSAQGALNATHTIRFRIRNGDAAPAKIESVTSTCGCTVPKDLKGVIIPASGEVESAATVQFPSPGELKQSAIHINVLTPARRELVINLKLRGPTISPPYIGRLPHTLRLGQTRSLDPPQQELRFRAIEEADSEPLVTGITASRPGIVFSLQSVRVPQTLPDGTLVREYRWLASASTVNVPLAERTGTLTFDVARPTTRPVPAVGYEVCYETGLRAIPDRIVLIGDSADADAIRLTLLADDEVEWDITSMEADAPWLSLEEDTPSNLPIRARSVLVRVNGAGPDLIDPNENVLITLQTSHPASDIVTVPVVVAGMGDAR